MSTGLPFSKPAGGFWPLGEITVAAAGNPQPLTVNVGNDGQGPLKLPRRVRQLQVYPAPGNTKPVYVMMRGYSHLESNGVIAVVYPGHPVALPHGCLLEGVAVLIDNYYLDAEVDGEGAYATAVFG